MAGWLPILTQERGTGAGKLLMQQSIKRLHQLFGDVPIKIKAQYYLLKFYQSFGFVAQGDVFLEDNIEHIKMVRPGAEQRY